MGSSGHGLQFLRIFSHYVSGGCGNVISDFSAWQFVAMWDMRYVGVIRLLFLAKHLCLIGVMGRWGSKNKHHKETCLKERCFKEIGLCFPKKVSTVPRLTMSAVGRTWCFMLRNQQTCTSPWPKLNHSDLALIFHCRFANATQSCYTYDL